ncbi:MAG: hydrogenase expression/formation protein HypE [Proteobacteria bacterium]|nr:hydrogenase expression/formation protein HypE [Pseudomonadota bacterium]
MTSHTGSMYCPTAFSSYEHIVLAHGGGGRAMHRLIDGLFARVLSCPDLDTEHDGALLDLAGPIAVTTDAFTVRPLFFPGGDIGRLAVCGTVNDIAMCGARPRHLAAAFVLEEGLALSDLESIVRSMATAAREAGVSVVTGDTKVVERGKGDGVYITTTGLGTRIVPRRVGPRAVRAGDSVLVSGPVGDHGMAVLSVREGLEHETPLQSDVAPVVHSVAALLEADIEVRFLRDPTRGGLASALCELASASGLGISLREHDIPIRSQVADACELLGLDPLYVASEGRFLSVVAAADAERALIVLRQHGCPQAARIGEILASGPGRVILTNAIGGGRVLDMLSGEQLPRIC